LGTNYRTITICRLSEPANRAKKETGFSYTVADIFQMAQENEEVAVSIVRDAINGAALCLSWLQQTIDPDIFILGGSIPLKEKEFIHLVREKMHQLLGYYMIQLPDGIQIVPAALGDDRFLIGAAALKFGNQG
jgi:glucokinase